MEKMIENSPDQARTPNGEPPVAIAQRAHRKKFNWNWVLLPVIFTLGIFVGCLGRPLVLQTAAPPDEAGQLQQALVSRTRHFKGSPSAPVTILEFSDFQ